MRRTSNGRSATSSDATDDTDLVGDAGGGAASRSRGRTARRAARRASRPGGASGETAPPAALYSADGARATGAFAATGPSIGWVSAVKSASAATWCRKKSVTRKLYSGFEAARLQPALVEELRTAA